MSVWKSTAYCDDAFQNLARAIPPERFIDGVLLPFLDFDIGDPGDNILPANLVAGNVKRQLSTRTFDIAKLSANPSVKPSAALYRTLNTYFKYNVKFGLHGVYGLICRVWDVVWDFKENKDEDYSLETTIYTAGMAAGMHSPLDVRDRCKTMTNMSDRYVKPIRGFIKELLRATVQHRLPSYRTQLAWNEIDGRGLPEIENLCPGIFNSWKIFGFRGCVLLYDTNMDTAYYLMHKDIDRIEKFLIGCANARVYAHMYGMLNPEDRAAFVKGVVIWQNEAIVQMRLAVKSNVANVCRKFDIIYNYFLAKISADLTKRSVELQYEKYSKEGFARDLGLDTFLNRFQDMPEKEVLEILQQYKLFPAADFDQYSAMNRQKILYDEHYNRIPDIKNNVHYANILNYHKWLLIIAFHEKHNICPGFVKIDSEHKDWHESYPYISPRAIPYVEADDIDLNGEFIFKDFADDSLELLKDKAICPEEIKFVNNQADLGRLKARYKSQLIDGISRDKLPNLTDLRENWDNLFFDVKSDDKAEAKKPNGRWFFEAGTDVRLVLSEYEYNINEYAKHVPGNISGADVEKSKRMLAEASKPGNPNIPVTPVLISFDLDKFSPGLRSEVTDMINAQWAEAFGLPEIAYYNDILKKGDIHYVKSNFHHKMQKCGADFEGFFGRRNTVLHCAVMGYTVNNLRERGFVRGSANFCALIDDGLLRVLVPNNTLHKTIEAICHTIEECYTGASFVISWDKTFISASHCVFLNEIRHYGRSITPGMKAILKITGMADVLVPNIISDLELTASTTRGAITAGATPSAAYAIYTLNVSTTIKRWAKKFNQFSIYSALKMFLPVNLGGLHLAGLGVLAGSLSHDALSESLGLLRIVGIRFPALRETIVSIIPTSVFAISDELKYSNPLSIRTTERKVTVNRFANTIKKFLLNSPNLPAIEPLLSVFRDEVSFDSNVLPPVSNRFPVELRTRVWSSTKKFVLEGLINKFLKAKSALEFVPQRVMFRVAVANKIEAVKYFEDLTR